MKTKPYIISTDRFLKVHHGGAYNPETLKNNRRGVIRNFSRASQNRMCFFVDSVENFHPHMIIDFHYRKMPDSILESSKNIYGVLSSLKDIYFTTKKPPLYVWKKVFEEKNGEVCFHYSVLTNASFCFSEKNLESVLYWKWKTFSKSKDNFVEFRYLPKKKEDDEVYSFCLDNQEFVPATIKNPGKFWGYLNLKYYRKKKLKKTEVDDLLKLSLIEAHLEQIDNNDFQKNFYKIK